MRRLAAVAGIFIAAILAGTLVARAGPEHDTTRDGVVDLRDALDVLSHFGESPGTPTPAPPPMQRRIVVADGSSQDHLVIDTESGAIVANLGPIQFPARRVSCDGRYAFGQVNHPGTVELRLIDLQDGGVVYSEWVSNLAETAALFPCPYSASQGAAPAEDRGVLFFRDYANDASVIRVIELSTGAVLFGETFAGGAPIPELNCAQDVVTYVTGAPTTLKIVRLSDGQVIAEFSAALPGNFVPYCAASY